MNILVSSFLLSLAIILLAHSIYELRPHRKHKRRKSVSKTQPTLRASGPGVDLRMTDLRRGGDANAR